MARRNQSSEEELYVMLPLYVLKHATTKLSGSQLLFLNWVQAYSRSAACLGKGYTASEWTVEKFTVPRLMKMLGMESDRGVQIMVRDLIDRGLIRRIPEEESDSPRQGYQYKLTSAAEWDAAPDYKPKSSPKPADDPDASDDTTTTESKGARSSVPPRGKIEIRFPEPVRQIYCRNNVNLALELSAESKPNGDTEFLVSVPDEINKRLESLGLNFSDGGNAVPRTAGSNGTVSPSHPRNTVPPSGGLPVPFAELRSVCDREVSSRRVKGVLSESIWAEVVENLGATPEKFAIACFEDSLREKYQRNYPVKVLLLPMFAADARNEWLKAPVEVAEPVHTPDQIHKARINCLVTALRVIEEDRAAGLQPWPEFLRDIDQASAEDLAEAKAIFAGELARIS